MKTMQFIAVLLLMFWGTSNAMAQHKDKANKTPKGERKVMKESNKEDKNDQDSYSKKMRRENNEINRKARKHKNK